jgi:ABC-type uncharacterized transport system auxiliary subunit
VHLAFAADLIDWTDRRLIARHSFSRIQAVPSRDAAGLALAASQSTGVLLGELVDWVASRASAQSPA